MCLTPNKKCSSVECRVPFLPEAFPFSFKLVVMGLTMCTILCNMKSRCSRQTGFLRWGFPKILYVWKCGTWYIEAAQPTKSLHRCRFRTHEKTQIIIFNRTPCKNHDLSGSPKPNPSKNQFKNACKKYMVFGNAFFTIFETSGSNLE